jgi:hypothetical protein
MSYFSRILKECFGEDYSFELLTKYIIEDTKDEKIEGNVILAKVIIITEKNTNKKALIFFQIHYHEDGKVKIYYDGYVKDSYISGWITNIDAVKKSIDKYINNFSLKNNQSFKDYILDNIKNEIDNIYIDLYTNKKGCFVGEKI